MPDFSKRIIYLSDAQRQELFTNDTITVDGVTITYNENDIYVTPQAEPVTDVRVNGTSISSGGVANIPVADRTVMGVGKVASDYGIQRGIGGLSDYLITAPADSNLIKSGSADNYGTYKPLTPRYQHEAAFYGLVKAAGADMKDIANTTVGIYPDAQKAAIQNMLGISNFLAPVETTVASKAYSVGESFTSNGKLYKVTTAIAQGGTIITQDVGATVSEHNAEETKISEYAVRDVQINGTSIMQNGVANMPRATSSIFGVIKLSSNGGLGITSSGGLVVSVPSDSVVKNGGDSVPNVALTVSKQEKGVFYGLAKAAGDTTQSQSNNAVGTYTKEAQSAIKSMIGIGEEAYFINKKDFTNPTTVNSNASSVINAALTAARAAGKNYCVVPEGEYWLTETIYLQDGVILKGCGMDATTLKIADGCDIDAIRVASPISNSGVMDLSIDGNRITNYNTFNSGHHGNAINVWLHYGRIERVRTNWVYKHSLLLNYDTGNSDDGLGFDSEHQNDVGNLNKVLWCDFRDSLLQGVMWGWRTMDSWMCYTNIGSHAANLYLEGGTSRFIGNHFDGDGDNGAGPEYNVYCGDGCKAMLFDGNIFENTQKQNIFFRQPSYSNQTMTITISNNIIRTCSKSQNEQYPNIYISGYSDSVKATEIAITGNQILNPDTNANNGYAGIHLAYCSNCKIIGNTFFNVGDNEVIVDNTCDNILNDGSLPRDVQVNGVSVLNQGVANVPVGGSDTFGVFKASGSTRGIGVNSSGVLYNVLSPDTAIKAGIEQYKPIAPYNQHSSTFYGLAKAAGDTTQSASSNAVGTYTDNAKAAIKSMLGIVDGSTGTVTVSGTTPTITAVENTRYVCGEVATLSFTPPASGISIVRFTSGTTATVLTLPSTVKFPEWFDATALEANTIYEMCITDGIYGAVMSWAL